MTQQQVASSVFYMACNNSFFSSYLSFGLEQAAFVLHACFYSNNNSFCCKRHFQFFPSLALG